MKTISLKNVTYTAYEKHILQGVSFSCSMAERFCLFGENGAGKSTLLKMITGSLSPDVGAVHMNGHVRTVYVAQEFDAAYAEQSIEEYVATVAGKQFYTKVWSKGLQLGFSLEAHKEKRCNELSGGQQKILALATAFAMSPDFLLLDEPENHIDIVSRMVLIEMLAEYRGGVIFISHDRMLIDAIATKVGELVAGVVHISEGGYDEYLQTKLERIGGLQRQFDAERKRIKELHKALVVLQQKAFLGHDVSQYRARKAEYEELKMSHKASGRPEDTQTKISLGKQGDALHTGKILIKIENAGFAYPEGAIIFEKVNLTLYSGVKLVLLGRNGAGKSTFLKCLMQELAPRTGSVRQVEGVSVSYFDQHADFSPEETPLEIIGHELSLFNMEAKAALGAVKFDADRMNTKTQYLSGGERMRLRLATAFGKKPDLLILDEPTNHIDEVTWEILLQACKDFKGALLLVSHDHEFIENFEPSAFLMMRNDTVEERHKDLHVLLEEMKEPRKVKKKK